MDYNSQKWIDATKAVFVKNSEFPTPMGYGIVAFSDTLAAETFIRQHQGDKLTFTEVMKQDFAKPQHSF